MIMLGSTAISQEREAKGKASMIFKEGQTLTLALTGEEVMIVEVENGYYTVRKKTSTTYGNYTIEKELIKVFPCEFSGPIPAPLRRVEHQELW